MYRMWGLYCSEEGYVWVSVIWVRLCLSCSSYCFGISFVLGSSFNIQTGWRTKHLEKDQYLVFTNPIKKIDKMTCDAPSAAIPTPPGLFSCIGVPSKMFVGERLY